MRALWYQSARSFDGTRPGDIAGSRAFATRSPRDGMGLPDGAGPCQDVVWASFRPARPGFGQRRPEGGSTRSARSAKREDDRVDAVRGRRRMSPAASTPMGLWLSAPGRCRGCERRPAALPSSAATRWAAGCAGKERYSVGCLRGTNPLLDRGGMAGHAHYGHARKACWGDAHAAAVREEFRQRASPSRSTQ